MKQSIKYVICALAALACNANAQTSLRQPNGTPLNRFGFATGPEMRTVADAAKLYNVINQVVGTGAVARSSLGWDPRQSNIPDFRTFETNKLEPALARGITLMPNIVALNLSGGGYLIPSDADWIEGIRAIVRQYGPGGLYQTGGTYVRNGNRITVAAHPGFRGLTDFEIWNEPNSPTGNVHGTMTYAIYARLLKLAGQTMRQEALAMGFRDRLNIVGGVYDGMSVSNAQGLHSADPTIFSYFDTYSIHAYSRFNPLTCDPAKTNRCMRNLPLIRAFLNSHGGAHLHMASTEGAYSGSTDTCRGPQVLTEEMQADYTELALNYIRSQPSLNFDFFLTYHPIDVVETYRYACNSKQTDNDYYKAKLGVVRPNLSLKVLGSRLRTLIDAWR